jgi:hypothetical protein
VLGLSLDEAKNVALVAATVFALGAIAAIWMMKTIVQKVLVAVLLIMLAFAAWSQRESLQECAAQVQANVTTGIADASPAGPTTTEPAAQDSTPTGSDPASTTCTFFGVDVTIP